MNKKQLEVRHRKKAMEAYRGADEKRWVFCYHAAQIVGKYQRGATLGLANDLGVQPDTVENHAHAYMIYSELCSMGKNESQFVKAVRKMPTVYYSHFRALYDTRNRYNLSIDKVFDLLFDIYMGEGSISSNDVDKHARNKYGLEYPLEYYCEKTMKDLTLLLQHKDISNRKDVRETAIRLFSLLGDGK